MNASKKTLNVLNRPFYPITEEFTFGEELGRGVSGVVQECTEIDTGRKMACKSISKENLKAKTQVDALRREIAAMECLNDCRQVASIYCSFEDEKCVHLVMENCKGGDLASKIESEARISEEESAHILSALAYAVMHFQSLGIVHRDLKPENILLCSNSLFPEIRIADSGAAAFQFHGDALRDIVGSPCYIAPEMLSGCYSREVDVWAMGVILYAMLSGRLPFTHSTLDGIFQTILKGKLRLDAPYWKCVSPSAKHLISRMLDPEPSRRITIAEILKHPWVLEHTSYDSCLYMGGKNDEHYDDEDESSIPIAECFSLPLDSVYSALPVEYCSTNVYSCNLS